MKLVWFRNDLRLEDHHALYQACLDSGAEGVVAVAAITPQQWQLQDEAHCRVEFWLAHLQPLSDQLAALNIPLKLIHVADNQELPAAMLQLAQQHQATGFYFNREYPEYEQQRDRQVARLLKQQGVRSFAFDADLVLPPGSVLNLQGQPYKVFTPFAKAWKRCYLQTPALPLPVPPAQAIVDVVSDPVPAQIDYSSRSSAPWQAQLWPLGEQAAQQRLRQFVATGFSDYKTQRDLPGVTGTSSLSPYLSCGVLSVRQCLGAIQTFCSEPDWFDNQWVMELIWREFYRHLLILFPEMNRWQPFKPEIEAKLRWEYNESLYQAWCRGETGFAIVDAGMKQLLQTGWMHNRVRMITASFLTKLLRHDWRLGAGFFMQHLIDGDFASNLGGWQWSASVGADAAPYFRIFNPMRQAERFDPQGEYVAQWLPELAGLNAVQQHDPLITTARGRPQPIIDYAYQRKLSTDLYNQAGSLP